MQAFKGAEASYLKVLAASASADPALVAQAKQNLAGLYHSWSRVPALPSAERTAYLGRAIEAYRGLPSSTLELAGALQERGEAKDVEEAKRLYAALVQAPPLEANPGRLMAQGNYALLSKDPAFAGHVCGAWQRVPGSERAPHAAARLKALTVHAYLVLSVAKDTAGALAAYTALAAFAQASGQALDVDAEHNLAVCRHLQAVQAAAAAAGQPAGAEAV